MNHNHLATDLIVLNSTVAFQQLLPFRCPNQIQSNRNHQRSGQGIVVRQNLSHTCNRNSMWWKETIQFGFVVLISHIFLTSTVLVLSRWLPFSIGPILIFNCQCICSLCAVYSSSSRSQLYFSTSQRIYSSVHRIFRRRFKWSRLNFQTDWHGNRSKLYDLIIYRILSFQFSRWRYWHDMPRLSSIYSIG